MGYKIGKCEFDKSVDDYGDFVETFYEYAYVKFNEIYIQVDFVPQIVVNTEWILRLDDVGFRIEPTKETKELLESREIIVSFWQDCVYQKIQSSFEYEILFCLKNEQDEEVWMYKDNQDPPWRRPAPVGTVFSGR